MACFHSLFGLRSHRIGRRRVVHGWGICARRQEPRTDEKARLHVGAPIGILRQCSGAQHRAPATSTHCGSENHILPQAAAPATNRKTDYSSGSPRHPGHAREWKRLRIYTGVAIARGIR
jgi:hypothetical protein